MKQTTGHDCGYIDSCDFGHLSRLSVGASHPRYECYTPPVYVIQHNGKDAFSCIDHFHTVNHMLLMADGDDEVTVRFYRPVSEDGHTCKRR